MSNLSGITDLDREILSKLDNRELLRACSIDKHTWNKVCNDDFLRRRLIQKYPEIETYKHKNESWKQFFIKAVNYIALMEEEFEYEYISGNFFKQYKLLHKTDIDALLVDSALEGEIYRVIWALFKGADIHAEDDNALKWASEKGHLDVVKYLVKHGSDINAEHNYALVHASQNGHLDVVKYLVENGANINDLALRRTKQNRHSEVVKYLMKYK